MTKGRIRVVITGLGLEVESAWQALLTGRSGISRVTQFDCSNPPCQIAGEASDGRPEDHFPARQARRLSRRTTIGPLAPQKAAACVFEAAVCAHIVSSANIHPTINHMHPVSDCDLVTVPNTWREADARVALSNSFGLARQNACLAPLRVED